MPTGYLLSTSIRAVIDVFHAVNAERATLTLTVSYTLSTSSTYNISAQPSLLRLKRRKKQNQLKTRINRGWLMLIVRRFKGIKHSTPSPLSASRWIKQPRPLGAAVTDQGLLVESVQKKLLVTTKKSRAVR